MYSCRVTFVTNRPKIYIDSDKTEVHFFLLSYNKMLFQPRRKWLCSTVIQQPILMNSILSFTHDFHGHSVDYLHMTQSEKKKEHEDCMFRSSLRPVFKMTPIVYPHNELESCYLTITDHKHLGTVS